MLLSSYTMSERTSDNRLALIEAALTSIAEIGLIRTSVTEIIDRAGLSRGMIHLHFGGKDALIIAAAEHANAQYYQILERDMAAAPDGAAARIAAMIHSDLSAETLNPRSVAIWYELRGAARTNATIAAYSDTRDIRLRRVMEAAFSGVSPADTPQSLAQEAAIATISMVEGMWTDYMLHPENFDRRFAARIVFRMLSSLFPDAFDLNGARGL